MPSIPVEDELTQESSEPNGFSIFNESLSQQVGKIHEATRLALPTFVESDSDDDSLDGGAENLKHIRPQHLTPAYQEGKVGLPEISAESSQRASAKTSFPVTKDSFSEDSWRAVESSQNMEESIEETFRLLLHKEHEAAFQEALSYDRDQQAAQEANAMKEQKNKSSSGGGDSSNVDISAMPLAGLNSKAFDQFLDDLESAQSSWKDEPDIDVSTERAKKASSSSSESLASSQPPNIASKKDQLTKNEDGIDESEGSAEMTWVLDYLEKQSASEKANGDDGLPELPTSLQYLAMGDLPPEVFPPDPPIDHTSGSTSLAGLTNSATGGNGGDSPGSGRGVGGSNSSIADQLREISSPFNNTMESSSQPARGASTLYDIKKTNYKEQVKSAAAATAVTSSLGKGGKGSYGGKGGKGSYGNRSTSSPASDFKGEDDSESSDSDDDADWRNKRAKAKKAADEVSVPLDAANLATGGVWGTANQTASEKNLMKTLTNKKKSQQVQNNSSIFDGNADTNSDLIRELLSSKPDSIEESSSDDDGVFHVEIKHGLVEEEEEEEEDSDEENDIESAVKTYADMMNMKVSARKQDTDESRLLDRENTFQRDKSLSVEKSNSEIVEGNGVLDFLSNLGKASEEAMEMLKEFDTFDESESTTDQVNESKAAENDDDNKDSQKDEGSQLDTSVALRNEKLQSEKMKSFEKQTKNPSSSSSSSPTPGAKLPESTAITALETVRKAAMKSLSQTPKNRKVFNEVVPSAIMDKTLRTLPMELWSDCFPSLNAANSSLNADTNAFSQVSSSLSSFEERVKTVSVLCVKEDDLNHGVATTSELLAWLMKLNHSEHDPKQTSPRNSPHKSKSGEVGGTSSSLASSNVVEGIRCKLLSLSFTVVSLAEKEQKETSNKNGQEVSNSSNDLEECFIPLSEPSEYSGDAKAVFLFALSFEENSKEASLDCEENNYPFLKKFLKTSPLPLSYFIRLKDTDTKSASTATNNYHPLELFTRLPSFRSWQPMVEEGEDADIQSDSEDSDDDNSDSDEKGEERNISEGVSISNDQSNEKDLITNSSDVAICLLKSHLIEDSKQETLQMILSRLLSNNSYTNIDSSESVSSKRSYKAGGGGFINKHETSSEGFELNREVGVGSCGYLVGLRMIHLEHNGQLFPPNAEPYLSYSSLEYLKSLEREKNYELGNDDSSSDIVGKHRNTVIYVLAFRGCLCVEKLNQILGPQDPVLAKATDPTSLRALYGKNRSHNLAVVPIGITLQKEFACWFGGRVHQQSLTSTSSPRLTTAGAGATAATLNQHRQVMNQLRPAPSIILKKRETVLLALWHDHASRLGDIIKISSLFGLSISHIQLVSHGELKLIVEDKSSEQGLDMEAVQSLYSWLNLSTPTSTTGITENGLLVDDERSTQLVSSDMSRRRACCIWFESELASTVVTNMLSSKKMFLNNTHIRYDMSDCFSCLDLNKSLLSKLCFQQSLYSISVMKQSNSNDKKKKNVNSEKSNDKNMTSFTSLSASLFECSSSDFHHADKISTDKSLPQTLVCVLPCHGNTGSSSLSAHISELLNKLLKAHHSSSNKSNASSNSKSPKAGGGLAISTSAAISSSHNSSFETLLSDSLPFELLGLKIFKKLNSDEATRIVSACSTSTNQEAISALTQTSVVMLAIRCLEGRRKIKALLADELELNKHHQYSHMLPSLFVSKAPRATLSLLSLFFPSYNILSSKETQARHPTLESYAVLLNSLSSDINYPIANRGLACLPPSQSTGELATTSNHEASVTLLPKQQHAKAAQQSLHHPLIQYFIPPELPITSTVSVVSPKLCWLENKHTNFLTVPSDESTNGSSSASKEQSSPREPGKLNRMAGHASRVKKPTVLIRILKRIEKENLKVRRLLLTELSNNQWDDVSEHISIDRLVSDGINEEKREVVANVNGEIGDEDEEVEENENKGESKAAAAQRLYVEGLSTVIELEGVHAISKWADSVGPSYDMVNYLVTNFSDKQQPSSHKSLATRNFLDKSIELDMHCLRSVVNMSNLANHDIGIYTAQSYESALKMTSSLFRNDLIFDYSSDVSTTNNTSERRFEKAGISLVETSCLVVIQHVIEQVGLSTILDLISHEEFDIVQVKVGVLTPEQADRFLSISSKFNRMGSSYVSRDELLKGPILVVATEKDNGVNKLKTLVEQGVSQSSSNHSPLSMFSTTFSGSTSQSSTSARKDKGTRRNHKQKEQDDMDSDNVFMYQTPAVGQDSQTLKIGAVCSYNTQEASEHLAMFFGQIYGVNNISL